MTISAGTKFGLVWRENPSRERERGRETERESERETEREIKGAALEWTHVCARARD